MLKRLLLSSGGVFKTRSADRDRATDAGMVLAIARAIDLALDTSNTERAGLRRRMDDVLSRAAIVGGNEIEEYQSRSEVLTDMLHQADVDIRAGEARLLVIEDHISNYTSLKDELRRRFPDLHAKAVAAKLEP